MKKIGILFMTLLMVVSMSSFASQTDSEFIGKWKLDVRDLPDGDAVMHLFLNVEDGELKGKLTGSDGKEEFVLYDIEIDKKELNFMYDARGHNIPVNLELIGEGKCEGYMIDMFLMEGVKVKEEKK